jgi:hypothetical protein
LASSSTSPREPSCPSLWTWIRSLSPPASLGACGRVSANVPRVATVPRQAHTRCLLPPHRQG